MSLAFAFGYPHVMDDADLSALLGGKGANLATMTRKLDLPVPPGFTVTTDTCRQYLASGWPAGLDAELDRQLGLLEKRVGRRFGDAADPLLVSVRSGAPVSMPGMMDTVLNLGLNDETVVGLAAVSGDPAFAADCHARFLEMFSAIVGVDDVPADPRAQLRSAIEAVFRSWNCDRARAYREVEGIDDGLGTAVTVQTMVFGNRGGDSATGVLFTRDPSTGDPAMFGDLLFNAQGEDVVDGSHHTQPISSLRERLPEVADELKRAAVVLEHHHRDLCDIEFTVEDGVLWMLQVRVGKRSPDAALRIAVEMAEDEDFPLTRRQAIERVAVHLLNPPRRLIERPTGVEVLAAGLPASPGLASGAIVTSPDEAVRRAADGAEVILVRSETSPADVHGMADAAGILTSKGGLACHAAVVARGWGIPAVVGAGTVDVVEDAVMIGGTRFAIGDEITIDGDRGDVYGGVLDGSLQAAPEAAVLLEWADELDIDLDVLSSPQLQEATYEWADAAVGTDLLEAVIRVAAIKNFVTVEALLSPVGVSAEGLTAALDYLVEVAVLDEVRDMYRLTSDGKERAGQLLTADQSIWGIPNAEAALDGLHPLDQLMKQIVTRWQVREVDGEEVINDHSDETYDRDVLAELVELHGDTAPWLDGLAKELPRLERYRLRLDTAVQRASDGDERFVAAPMVDSYHTVWFEMHEDLIRLAGRTREAEAAAGRA